MAYIPPGYWSRASMIEALRQYVEAHGVFPHMKALGNALGLPSKEKARREFGSLAAYYAAVGIDAPRQPKRKPGQGQHHEPRTDTSTPVTCLACDAVFLSPDKRHVRFCDGCRGDRTRPGRPMADWAGCGPGDVGGVRGKKT